MSKLSSIAKIITPQKGYLLLEVLENEHPSTFQIADNDQIPQRGRVLVVGPSTWHEGVHERFESPAEVGDVVLHSGFGYEDFRMQGHIFRMCPFSKVIATIKGDDYEKAIKD